jgi:hypothetical protein
MFVVNLQRGGAGEDQRGTLAALGVNYRVIHLSDERELVLMDVAARLTIFNNSL